MCRSAGVSATSIYDSSVKILLPTTHTHTQETASVSAGNYVSWEYTTTHRYLFNRYIKLFIEIH